MHQRLKKSWHIRRRKRSARPMRAARLFPYAAAFLVATVCIAQNSALSEKAPVFVVLADDELPLYRQVVTGIAVEANATVHDFHLNGAMPKDNTLSQRMMKDSPQVLFAIGPKSLNVLAKMKTSAPIVFTMVPGAENLKINRSGIRGIRINASDSKRLKTLKTLLPDVKRVAVVYSKQFSAETIVSLTAQGEQIGLEIVGIEASSAAQMREALAATSNIHAVFMISDPVVLNIEGFQTLTKYTERQGVPLVSLDRQFVERGALFAFEVVATDLGRQAGRLGSALLSRSETELAEGLREPVALQFSLNLETSERVSPDGQFVQRALKVAAEEGWVLRAFEASSK